MALTKRLWLERLCQGRAVLELVADRLAGTALLDRILQGLRYPLGVSNTVNPINVHHCGSRRGTERQKICDQA